MSLSPKSTHSPQLRNASKPVQHRNESAVSVLITENIRIRRGLTRVDMEINHCTV